MTTRTPIRFGIQTGQQGVEWAQMLDTPYFVDEMQAFAEEVIPTLRG